MCNITTTPKQEEPKELYQSSLRKKAFESGLSVTIALILLASAFLNMVNMSALNKVLTYISLILLLGALLIIGSQLLRSHDIHTDSKELVTSGLRRYIIIIAILGAIGLIIYDFLAH